MRFFIRSSAAILTILLLVCALLPVSLSAGVYTPPEEPAAVGVLIVNEDTGLVMYEKNADERLYPASMTKIMTCLIILETVSDLEATKATMTAELLTMIQGTGSAVMNLKDGETVTMKDLLYALLLSSAGDGALLAAQTAAGSVEAFVALMNAKAAELGCTDTHFTNPHGLHDDNHYTTPRDLYRIICAANEYPLFREVVQTSRYNVPATNKSGARTLVNTNIMLSYSQGGTLYYEPIRGIKTGFTTPAGYCLASTATKNGETYTIVLMKSELTNADGTLDRQGAFKLTKQLYEWLFGNFNIQQVLSDTEVRISVPVNYGEGADEVGLVASEEFLSMLPKNADESTVVMSYSVVAEVDAPVTAGQELGTAEITVAGETLGFVTLVAANDVERNDLSYAFAQVGKFFSSKVMIIIGIILLALVVGYILLNVAYNKKKHRHGAVRGAARPNNRRTGSGGRNIFR